MTKSSARKAAAEKTRGTHRKTARKVGAAKAHSDRSQDSFQSCRREGRKAVAEKARGSISQDRHSI